jgi:hypothetical protein
MSLVQHLAEAGVITLPLASRTAGVNGCEDLAASGVSRMLVVVCSSHCRPAPGALHRRAAQFTSS